MKAKLLSQANYFVGDTAPPIDVQILNEDGTPYSIPGGTSVTVYLLGEKSVSLAASITDAAQGIVRAAIPRFALWVPPGEYSMIVALSSASGEMTTDPISLVVSDFSTEILIDGSSWNGSPYGQWSNTLVVTGTVSSSIFVEDSIRSSKVTAEALVIVSSGSATLSLLADGSPIASASTSTPGSVQLLKATGTVPEGAVQLEVSLQATNARFILPTLFVGDKTLPLR